VSEGARFGILERFKILPISVNAWPASRRANGLTAPMRALFWRDRPLNPPSTCLHRSRRQRHAQIYLFGCGSLFNELADESHMR
jgi:hypothetical protein